jgi:hypothetical protein
MGILAVAIDGGRIYTLRRDAQNAADAAALQGARALCRDEDYVAAAEGVAERGGFAGAGVVEVNNPPVRSDSPTINDDQVEVVITATIDGGLIAPIVYQGELDTRVLAVGDCLRGTLSGSGSAIFAGGSCPTNEVNVGGSSVYIIGGVHSNGEVQIGGGGGGNVITGTVTYVVDTNLPNGRTTMTPPQPVNTSPSNYPLNLEYADFTPGGFVYDAVMADNPNRYHYYAGEITKPVLAAQGWLTGTIMKRGLYVTPVGFQFNGAGGGVFVGDDVTLVTQGEINFSVSNSTLRPYVEGLLFMTEHDPGTPCSNNPVISVSGSGVSWGGIIYAPNGKVNMNASGGSTFFGSIIASQVDLSGSNLQIIYDPSYLPPDPDTIELGQ